MTENNKLREGPGLKTTFSQNVNKTENFWSRDHSRESAFLSCLVTGQFVLKKFVLGQFVLRQFVLAQFVLSDSLSLVTVCPQPVCPETVCP